MKTTRKSDTQTMHIINQPQTGTPVAELCREMVLATPLFISGVLNMAVWTRL